MRIIYLKNLTSLTELRNKYWELSKKYHPDLNPTIGDDLFKQLNAEYQYLQKNPKKLKGKINLKSFINAQYKICVDLEYKKSWVYQKYKERLEGLGQEGTKEEIELIAKLCKFKEGWIFYKIKELGL